MANLGLVSFPFVFLLIIANVNALGLFDDLLGDVTPCEDVCKNTYPQHTYEKATPVEYCRRGCRFFTIIDFVEEYTNVNQTKEACAGSCGEAYRLKDNRDACTVGCDSQVSLTAKRQNEAEWPVAMDEQISVFYPLLYVHGAYSNMIDKLSNHVQLTWSFYAASDNGKMVIIRSDPLFLEYERTSPSEYKTANYIETNLAAVDNSATPNLKHSQMHSMERDIPGGGTDGVKADTNQSSDWLGCIAMKTGLPRLLLSLTIFVSAMVMIWLCVTTAATAPEHRISSKPQKVSIYGDLEYLRGLDDKDLLSLMHPQEKNDNAAPLPIKIKVQKI